MMQISKCECGEEYIVDHRCELCSRVRPSSHDLLDTLTQLNKQIQETINDLCIAIKLEQEDLRRGHRSCQNVL